MRCSKLVSFLKNGESVRPIALTSCICKLFETLVKNRLQCWCESNDILPMTQSGFRAGRSCVDNLINMSICINEAFTNRQQVLAAFLDISGAFDNVRSDTLLERLASIGYSKKMIVY